MYYIYGADTETCRGEPFSFQIYGDGGVKRILWVNHKKATKAFVDMLKKLPKTRPIVIFVHNLEFDLISFLYDNKASLAEEMFYIKKYGVAIQGVYANVKFATITGADRRNAIYIVDTFAYFKTSAAKLATMFCPHLPKLAHPKGLGEKRFTAKDKGFVVYAMRDAEIGYFAGRAIIAMHHKYDIKLSISAPQMASRVFRHSFMRRNIPLPRKSIVYSALHSYHGGKNNITVPPGWYKRIRSLDIVSAYPAAMAKLPSFSMPELYKSISMKKGAVPKAVPVYGVYKISGVAKKCKWPIIYDHAFKPIAGEFKNIWTTGPELNEALRTGEIKLTAYVGWYYDADKDKYESPFKKYAEHFFNLKDTAKSAVDRAFFKLLLNSLYGKFIQTLKMAGSEISYDLDNPKDGPEREKHLVAGGLFHPFVATLITGQVRAWIHALEHDYKSLHTATDSVFTKQKPKEKKGLGGQSIEVYGDLLLFRNKLYIFYTNSAKMALKDRFGRPMKSSVFAKRYIAKYALHGFHASVFTLEKMYVNGVKEYDYVKVNKLRESLRRRLRVNNFEKRTASVKF